MTVVEQCSSPPSRLPRQSGSCLRRGKNTKIPRKTRTGFRIHHWSAVPETALYFLEPKAPDLFIHTVKGNNTDFDAHNPSLLSVTIDPNQKHTPSATLFQHTSCILYIQK